MTSWAWDATAASVRANSQQMMAAFQRYGGPFAWFAAEVGVGTVKPGTAMYAVHTAGKPGGPFDPIVYFPAGVAPGVATDGHLAVDDQVRGRWQDFEMYRDQGYSGGKVSGWTGGCSMAAGAAQEPSGGGSHGGATVAKFPLLQGLVTLDDLRAGEIAHPLVYTMTNCGPAPNPYPSGQRSSYSGPNVAMPLPIWHLMPSPGTWLALPPKLPSWLPSLRILFERLLVAALQWFGMFCRDRSTDCSLHGADPGGGGSSFTDWRAAGVALNAKGSVKLSAAFLAHLQLLRCLEAPRP
jgi:hypothetical protein